MRKIIQTLLGAGCSDTKKYKVADLPYFLRPLFKDRDGGGITANDNPFWSQENQENRVELMHDMQGYKEGDIRSGTAFQVLNRIENGDAYGIASGKCFRITRKINGRDVVIELTPREQRLVWEKQELAYCYDAVKTEIDCCGECFGTSLVESEDLFPEMAQEMFTNLHKHDMEWEAARNDAINAMFIG